MNEQDVRALIAGGETATVEFKSDQGPLPDADLVETAVCLANGEGGTLLIGVEDDGRVTGLHPRHRSHPAALAAFIANRTVPPVRVEAEFVTLPEGLVAVVILHAARQPVSTSDGRLLIRYLDAHGLPGCRPLYSHELHSWRADRGAVDVSALPLPGAAWSDFDELEFVRLRRMVEENHGDAKLLELSNEGIARALGLVWIEGDNLIPTLTGMLLVGRESALRTHVPTHQVAFQVLHGSAVRSNEFRHWPLLRVQEWLLESVSVRNEEQELMLGGMRVGVPRYDRAGLREAINNALIHRDYGQLGAVHVQLHDGYALITNPGGFVVGVNAHNLLVIAPRARNPLLADAFKRIGLVEKTGRGVGMIYTGQLRNGRPAPAYDRSGESSVTVELDARPADLEFVQLAIQAARQLNRTMTVEDYLILWQLWQQSGSEASAFTPLLQRDEVFAVRLLTELVNAGLLQVEKHLYRLSPLLLKTSKPATAYAAANLEDAVLDYARVHGQITRQEVADLCRLSPSQAYRLLKKLVATGALRQTGPHTGRGVAYELNA